MQLIGMMTVRNEDDIVEQCLVQACKYHDLIFVCDCGSDDKTVDIVKSFTAKSSQVVFLGEVGTRHSRQVKHHIWCKFKKQFDYTAWWSVVDADEFLEEDPKLYITKAEAELADHIFAKIANFYFTDLELDNWINGRETLDDRQRPINERRIYYRMHTSQVRMFRNLPWLRWNEDTHLPLFLAKPATKRPVYRHYQYRDPLQMEKRILTRRDWLGDSAINLDNPHWNKSTYMEAISSTNDPHLKKASKNSDLESDPDLPTPNKSQSFFKTFTKYTYALIKGMTTRQSQDTLFG
jgi:glycosyltransferase involved in cell wall biosynthesis